MRMLLALLLIPFASGLVAEDPAGDAFLEPGGIVSYPGADLRSLDVTVGEQLEIALTLEQLTPNLAGAWFQLQFNHEAAYYSLTGYIGSEGGIARFGGETYDMTIEGNTVSFLFPMRHLLDDTEGARTLQNFSVQTNARPTYTCIVGGTPTCTNSVATVTDFMIGEGSVPLREAEAKPALEPKAEAKETPMPFIGLVIALFAFRRSCD